MQTFVGFHILTYEDSSRNFWLNIGNFLHDQMNHLPIKRISFHFPCKFVCVCVCVCIYLYIYIYLSRGKSPRKLPKEDLISKLRAV